LNPNNPQGDDVVGSSSVGGFDVDDGTVIGSLVNIVGLLVGDFDGGTMIGDFVVGLLVGSFDGGTVIGDFVVGSLVGDLVGGHGSGIL
jgi:hypothetical protein